MTDSAEGIVKAPGMTWGDLEVLCQRIQDRVKGPNGTVTKFAADHQADVKIALDGINDLRKAGGSLPPKETHPALHEVNAELEETLRAVMEGKGTVNLKEWDRLETLADRMYRMKVEGLGTTDNPAFVDLCGQIGDGIRRLPGKMPPPITHPCVNTFRETIEQQNRLIAAGMIEGEIDLPGSDSIETLIRSMKQAKPHSGRKVTKQEVVAWSRRLAKEPKFLMDEKSTIERLATYFGMVVDDMMETYLPELFTRLTSESFPVPYGRFVVDIRQDDDQKESHIVCLCTWSPETVTLRVIGWMSGARGWIGPFEFSHRAGTDHVAVTSAPTRDEASRRLLGHIHALLRLFFIALSVPHRQNPVARGGKTSTLVSGHIIPTVSYRQVQILPEARFQGPRDRQGKPRLPPRRHMVRQHDRHLADGRVITIPEHPRGDAARGVVIKNYGIGDV